MVFSLIPIRRVFLSLILFYSFLAHSQTLIMNEVSNGTSGNQEYVEFVVISDTVTYSCNNTTPPCIDIRGWIFDDNSGYHGSGGVAAGAVRFSQNPIWACVPLGTIILIYNNADRNPAIPPDDLSMSDGNCTIIAPLNSTLFESNPTTPGAVACSYPGSGWVSGGNWNNTLLANPGDCARIVNLAGCEVFSVCYGTDNQNNLIYFSGSGGQKVYYFNDTDPTNQANWSSGSASPSPGDQTPGAPNNALNAAFIAQYNNGCQPITPLQVVASFTNAGCSCNGSSTAQASGSIGGYTYEWLDQNSNPIGQTNATATGLCAGVYKVVARSHIGCTDTATVTISGGNSAVLSVNSPTICFGQSAVLTATAAISGGTYTWLPGSSSTNSLSVSPGSSTSYTVNYQVATCTSSTVAYVTVNPLPVLSVNSTTVCQGTTATLAVSGATSYTWSSGAQSASMNDAPSATTSYSVTGSLLGCTQSTTATITVLGLPTISVNSPIICAGQNTTLTATGASSYQWSNGATTPTISVSPGTTESYTVTGTANTCSSSAVTSVFVNPLPVLNINQAVVCSGQTATLQVSGANTYTWDSGSNQSSVIVTPLTTGNYSVSGTLSGCVSSTVTVVQVNTTPTISVTSATICSGDAASLTASGASTYQWSNGANGPQFNEIVTGNSSYTVIGISSGCVDTAIANVFVIPLPTISVSSASICPGQLATLAASGAITYTWSEGSNGPNITVSPSSTTAYTVAGTENGCRAFAVGTVSVFQAPNVQVNSVSICQGQTATLSAEGANSFMWDNGATSNTVSVSPGVTSTYTVMGSNGGCSAQATATVIVNPIPAVNFSVGATQGCAPLCVLFTDMSASGISSWNWQFGNSETSSQQNPWHCFDMPGDYDVTLTVVSNNGCTNKQTQAQLIHVYPTPDAQFSSDANNTDIIDPLVQFTNHSTHGDTYVWSFGDSTNSTISDPSHLYSQEGNYLVTLIVTNNDGCIDSVSNEIKIKAAYTFYAPNSFTPNGDHKNDIFLPLGTGWNDSTFELYIFDRWGNQCFSSKDSQQGWDGKANHGKETAEIDTYTWKVELDDVFKKHHSYIGHVTIIR